MKKRMVTMVKTEKEELLMQRVMQLMRKRTITLADIEKEVLMVPKVM